MSSLARSEITEASDGVVALGRFQLTDVGILVEGDKDPELRRRFGVPECFVPSAEHSFSVLARWEDERVAGTRLTFAVRDAATSTLVGGCELQPRADGVANLSYWTYPVHRGHGIASRAVALVVRIAFDTLGLAALEVLITRDNCASLNVAARNGFGEVGLRDGQLLYVLDNPMTSRE